MSIAGRMFSIMQSVEHIPFQVSNCYSTVRESAVMFVCIVYGLINYCDLDSLCLLLIIECVSAAAVCM